MKKLFAIICVLFCFVIINHTLLFASDLPPREKIIEWILSKIGSIEKNTIYSGGYPGTYTQTVEINGCTLVYVEHNQDSTGYWHIAKYEIPLGKVITPVQLKHYSLDHMNGIVLETKGDHIKRTVRGIRQNPYSHHVNKVSIDSVNSKLAWRAGGAFDDLIKTCEGVVEIDREQVKQKKELY